VNCFLRLCALRPHVLSTLWSGSRRVGLSDLVTIILE
jgi:hypothetical protein